MNIGIIVHSQTGNTLHVANRLKEQLEKTGHHVTLSRMKTLGESNSIQNPDQVELDHLADAHGYDVIIFGGWVQAFNLCQGFSKYLHQLETLNAKEVHCFVTHHFPFAWMGGNHAISQMKKILRSKNVTVHSTVVFNWSRKNNLSLIDTWAETFSQQYFAK